YSFAMPETGIGFVPDIGGGYFFSRMPGEMGVYLGITGRSIGRADAYYTGAATHCIAAADFDKIRHAMIESDPIDPVLDDLHRDPGEGELAPLQGIVDRIFSEPTVEAILARLDETTGLHADWARETAATIRRNAPLALKVALRQIRGGKAFGSLKEALAVDFRLARAFLAAPDFREGVRARIIDKDHSPTWSPRTLEEVTDAMVDACFACQGDGELDLKDRWTLVV
ncbi:MAG: enoyl-CoA hydratase/isomerase family protein, partial [Alphaproteobacteria bacterium]